MTLQLVFFSMMTVVVILVLAILYKMFLGYQSMIQTTTSTVANLQSSYQDQISQLAKLVVSATTEGTTKSQADHLRLAETLILGREQEPGKSDGQATGGQSEPEPIPGIETLEGLSPSMIQALRREAEENSRLQSLSRMPPTDLGDHLPVPDERVTPESWRTD